LFKEESRAGPVRATGEAKADRPNLAGFLFFSSSRVRIGSLVQADAIDHFVMAITSAEVGIRHAASSNPIRSEGHVMIWTSDSRWIVLYSTLATLFICSWAFVPA
jgi:hypothetical protein